MKKIIIVMFILIFSLFSGCGVETISELPSPTIETFSNVGSSTPSDLNTFN